MAKGVGLKVKSKGKEAKQRRGHVAVKKLSKSSMTSALKARLKKNSGRHDIRIDEQPQLLDDAAHSVPITERGGYPVIRKKGSADPKKWVTVTGVPVSVDFNRCRWLPDDWGQGVKATLPNSRSKPNGGGGILTCFVSPEMKVYFHKEKVEEHVGRTLSDKDGFNGQVRLAKLQAQQTIQLARLQIREVNKGGTKSFIGADKDSDFFRLLSATEKKCLPSKEEFHFCVVSARRATKLEGVRDIVAVQTQLQEAGITPTWYVDAESLEDYKALGLKALVGGKLTPSRNKALDDAAARKKICVQMSDDIAAWEYRHGERASNKTDDAMNKAHALAQRFIVTPVAAARFIVAKMRASPDKPKLGGVYMLGSCARTFAGPEFVDHHFILGDFFVVDKGSSVRFDENMKLKEDYDFTCAHLKAHGSVLRCNRMTLTVKHYSNCGGAVATRDSKGVEEQRNIAILKSKWPGCFHKHPKRKNEVVLRWKATAEESEDDDDIDEGQQNPNRTSKSKKAASASRKESKKASVPGRGRTIKPFIKSACGA